MKGTLDPKTKGYESMWQKADGTDNVNAEGAWVCEPPNCMVLKQVQDEATGEMTEFYTIDPNLEAYITVAGFYRLHVKFREYKVSIEDGEIKQDFAIGEGYTLSGVIDAETGTKKGDSPYEFYVLPATSDTENSALGSVDGSGAAAPANACTLADTAAAAATAASNAALDAAAFEASDAAAAAALAIKTAQAAAALAVSTAAAAAIVDVGDAVATAATAALAAQTTRDTAAAAAAVTAATAAAAADNIAATAAAEVGPGTCCPPRHTVPFSSTNDGSKCFG